MPKGYVIGSLDVSDREKLNIYAGISAEIVKKHNGKFVVAGGAHQWVEGSGKSIQLILEFDSYEGALGYYNSAEYQEARKLRVGISDANIVIVEGVEDQV